MLVCNYHTYKDINDKDWVGGDAFNIQLSNTEDIIYDVLDSINKKLSSEGLKAIFRNDDKDGDLRQAYEIYDYVDGFGDEDYVNEGNYVGFGFIQLKD